jgi:hypothetical protein
VPPAVANRRPFDASGAGLLGVDAETAVGNARRFAADEGSDAAAVIRSIADACRVEPDGTIVSPYATLADWNDAANRGEWLPAQRVPEDLGPTRCWVEPGCHLGDAAADAIGAYARSIADAIGLHDWKIALMAAPAPGDVSACVQSVYGRRLTLLFVGEGFASRSKASRRSVIVHELLHAHFRDTERLASDAGDHMRAGRFEPWYSAYVHANELVVDAITDALAPRLPLPD